MVFEAEEATLPFSPVSDAVSTLVERVSEGVVQVGSQGRGQGSGVIWSADGSILTNHHVVAHARGQLRVTLADGRGFLATLVDSDARLDLALLRIAATGLPAVPVGDSTRLRVGELVFAIGHPWGQRGVVTAGVISGLDTTPSNANGRGLPYIRTDTRLRPGNSGGPLLNARGEVIGINAMVFGGDLSIAIPSHVASAWSTNLPGQRVTLGVQLQAIDLPASARQGALVGRKHALLIAGVVEGSTAERMGLLVGDVLLDADGLALESAETLQGLLAQHRPGSVLQLTWLRAGSVQSRQVTLAS